MIPLDRAKATCVLLVVLASLSLAAHVHGKDKNKDKGKKKRAAGAAAIEGEQRIAVAGVREPSGIAVHPKLRHLFVVGDEGTLGELDGTGRTLRVDPVAGNLEDLAFHPPSGMLVLLVENPPGLVVYDPVAHAERRRVALDVAGLLQSRAPEGGKGRGFEGLAFRPEAGRPGGGVFYLAHQRSPATVVAAAFDPLRATTVGPEAVVGRWPMDGYQHLTAISWDPSQDRFLLIADGRLAVLGADGATVSRSGPLAVAQPEGVCVDERGALWIVDDPTGLVRFDGGVAALTLPQEGGT